MTGIVYYSKNGNTQIVAELLKEKYQGTVIKLDEICKRKGFFGFLKSGFQAVRKKQSKLIGEPWNEAKQYKKLYLCTPVWAGSCVPAMNTFMANANFIGKEIIIVTVMADPKLEGAGKVYDYMTQIIKAKGGSVTKSVALNGSSPFEKGEINHIKRQFDTCL